MSSCCCSLAGTAACKYCANNPYAEKPPIVCTVQTDTTQKDYPLFGGITVAKPFGNGADVCPVCGKPSTIGKPATNADRIRSMTDEELAVWLAKITDCGECKVSTSVCMASEESCACAWHGWLQKEVGE